MGDRGWQQESDQSELAARLGTLKKFEPISTDASDQVVFFLHLVL
jgi:hypothetical protein